MRYPHFSPWPQEISFISTSPDCFSFFKSTFSNMFRQKFQERSAWTNTSSFRRIGLLGSKGSTCTSMPLGGGGGDGHHFALHGAPGRKDWTPFVFHCDNPFRRWLGGQKPWNNKVWFGIIRSVASCWIGRATESQLGLLKAIYVSCVSGPQK